jgi:protein-L-isoaspartate O-methyltransferase
MEDGISSKALGLVGKTRSDMSSFPYIGTELEAFSHARNWKRYLHRKMEQFIHGDVLEVGTGIGNNTSLFSESPHSHWTCLEPDGELAERIPRVQNREVIVSTISSVAGRRFDSILYIDVLEHIEDDGGEMQQAYDCLKPGGHLVILVPAHQWLFSPMDTAIGHFRRYNRTNMTAAAPKQTGAQLVTMDYLDSVGMAASLGNRLLLKASAPSVKQIQFWDSYMVPISTAVDGMFGHRIGKSLLAVWRKPA